MPLGIAPINRAPVCLHSIPAPLLAFFQQRFQGELEAVQRYAQHITASQNPALQRLWHRIRQDEIRHAHWLRMALSGHVPGGGSPRFRPGDVVVPLVAHMPEYTGKAARVVQVVNR